MSRQTASRDAAGHNTVACQVSSSVTDGLTAEAAYTTKAASMTTYHAEHTCTWQLPVPFCIGMRAGFDDRVTPQSHGEVPCAMIPLMKGRSHGGASMRRADEYR